MLDSGKVSWQRTQRVQPMSPAIYILKVKENVVFKQPKTRVWCLEAISTNSVHYQRARSKSLKPYIPCVRAHNNGRPPAETW